MTSLMIGCPHLVQAGFATFSPSLRGTFKSHLNAPQQIMVLVRPEFVQNILGQGFHRGSHHMITCSNSINNVP